MPTIEDKYAFDENYKVFGKGSHGKVIVGKVRADPGSEVAIKVSEESMDMEANILEFLKDKCSNNILQKLDYFKSPSKYYLVTEYLKDHITLDEWIKRFRDVSVDTKINVITQIQRTIDCIHKNNVVHRDIKPENIMINNSSQNPNIKMIDFGSACIYECDNVDSGTAAYLPPEFNKNHMNFINNKYRDLWAVGITLLDVLVSSRFYDCAFKYLMNIKSIRDKLLSDYSRKESLETIINKHLHDGNLETSENKILLDFLDSTLVSVYLASNVKKYAKCILINNDIIDDVSLSILQQCIVPLISTEKDRKIIIYKQHA